MAFNKPIPESRRPGKMSGGFAAYIEAEKLIQIAIVMPSAVFIGWLLGAWLDSRLHQSWITLAGIVVGSIAGLTSAIRMALVAGGDAKGKGGGGTEHGDPGKQE